MITGKYIVKYGDVIIERKNVITNNGFLMMNKYLAGNTTDWAGALAVGVLATNSPSATQTALDYEVSRYPVTLKTYKAISSASNQIVLKATLDPSLYATIYELGIFPLNILSSAQKDNVILSDFSESYQTGSSLWQLNGNYISGSSYLTSSSGSYPASRFGNSNIILSSGSTISISKTGDMTNYLTTDYLSLLYFTTASIASQTVTVRLADSASNIWTSSATITSAASGWNTLTIPMSASKSSSFNNALNSASITLGSGSSSLSLDAIKFVSGDYKTPEYLMTSRTTFSYPLTSYSQTGTTITFTASSTSGMYSGNLVTVSGTSITSGSSVNGTYSINTVPTASTFTVISSTSQSASGTGGNASMGIVKTSGQPMDIEYYIQVT